jgi:RNA polymerase sigma-70 factor (ECF subfamily)
MKLLSSGEHQRIQRIVDGDEQAFQSLVRDYYGLAFTLACKTLNNRQDSEEVVQDAFVKIREALDSFRGEASLKTWILRIVMRLSLNRRRDRSRSSWNRMGLHTEKAVEEEEAPDSPSGQQSPEAELISRETGRRVLALIDELPEPLRQALVLNSIEELSYEEIGRILRIPLGTVSSRIYSARKKLAKKLQEHDLL